MIRQLLAETAGTALLLAAIVGSGIMAEHLTSDTALALLCNSLATGAMLVVLITIFGPVSGAHLNPAVTLVLRLRRMVGTRLAAAYVACQIGGALLGTWTAHAMFEQPVFQVSTHLRSGPGLWLAEGVATFGLLLTILGTLRWKPEAVAVSVGLYIVSAYWFTASTSFANPAVTLARAFTNSFAGIEPSCVMAFILAQLAGALAGAAFGGFLFADKSKVADER